MALFYFKVIYNFVIVYCVSTKKVKGACSEPKRDNLDHFVNKTAAVQYRNKPGHSNGNPRSDK